MQQQLEEAYQKAVALVEDYKSKDINSLTDEEKEELKNTIRKIEELKPHYESLTMITSLP